MQPNKISGLGCSVDHAYASHRHYFPKTALNGRRELAQSVDPLGTDPVRYVNRRERAAQSLQPSPNVVESQLRGIPHAVVGPH